MKKGNLSSQQSNRIDPSLNQALMKALFIKEIREEQLKKQLFQVDSKNCCKLKMMIPNFYYNYIRTTTLKKHFQITLMSKFFTCVNDKNMLMLNISL